MTDSSDPAASAAADPSAAASRPTDDYWNAEPDPPDPDSDQLDPNIREMTAFGPVPVRYRHDGWVPDRQKAFIEMLADTGCVDTAARSVGMSRNAAYALRRRGDAQAFRLAWDAATDAAVVRLADAALARAINGVAVPVFYGGEQIGERRQFNERLTMFLLRYRDPVRYGKWHDRMAVSQPQDAQVSILSFRIGRLLRTAWRAFEAALSGRPAPLPEREALLHEGD